MTTTPAHADMYVGWGSAEYLMYVCDNLNVKSCVHYCNRKYPFWATRATGSCTAPASLLLSTRHRRSCDWLDRSEGRTTRGYGSTRAAHGALLHGIEPRTMNSTCVLEFSCSFVVLLVHRAGQRRHYFYSRGGAAHITSGMRNASNSA